MTEYIMRYENEVLQLLPDKIQPLIRCKDCKHAEECEIAFCFGEKDDWFCADGERNEGR